MSSCVQLQFNLDHDVILQDFEDEIDRNPHFDCINIQNVPTLQSGLELILSDWFKQGICDLPNVFGIVLKIDAVIDEKINDRPRAFEFRSKTSFLVAFESNIGNHEAIIFWKGLENDEFYSVFVDGNITTMLCDFLIQEIKAGRSGITSINPNRKKVRLHEIRDGEKRDLLTIAVNNSQSDVVRNLLSHDFAADSVINLAWELYLASNDIQKPIKNQIVLTLLHANSKLPDNFDYDRASPEIKGFIDWCENLQKVVDKDDWTSLQTKLDMWPNLNYFYDRNSQSLLTYAIKRNETKSNEIKSSKIYTTFARRLNIGSHENIESIYQSIQKTDKRMMRKIREQNPFIFPQTHLLVLKSKTRISRNDQNADKHWEYIVEAYVTIDSIEYCSKILQVAAECKSVAIFFDFKHDSTYYLDPATSVYSKGIIYESGTIYIGAKDLLIEATKKNVFGVIAHELCHLAVYMSFMNRNFDPFPTGESELKTRFVERVMVQCKQNEESEEIIGNVFWSYPKEVQDSEMIVTYPQILMQYFGDAAKIEQLEQIFDELVKYSKEVVKIELDKTLQIPKLINDENYPICYHHLTEPMKQIIINAKIKFQGVDTTVFELVRNDHEILKHLTSENIRKILLKNQSIEIGESIKLDMQYGIISRNFEKMISENVAEESSHDAGSSRKKRKLNKPKTETRTFEQIRDETSNSKVFLLADHAGSGKTTIFKNCAKKLKEFHKNYWVSFINLRKHRNIFHGYKNQIDTLTLEHVGQMLQQIVNPKPDFEASVFTKLFHSGQVIFLFDGVDEISPIYTELMLKIFSILVQMEQKNQMWISTRPHYADKLSTALSTLYHTFTQYKPSETDILIKEIFKFHGISDEKVQKKNLSQVKKCLKELKGNNNESKEIENPVMVQMITELYIEKRLDPEENSRFAIYEAMVEKQKDIVGVKIPNYERDVSRFSIWTVIQLLALIYLIEKSYEKELKFNLNDLRIMQIFKKEKSNWTSDKTQRYGFGIADLSSNNVDRNSIDFIHRTYAEFFAASFFIEAFSSDSHYYYKDPKIINLYIALNTPKKNFSGVEDFVISFAKYNGTENETVCFDKFKEFYKAEINEILQISSNRQEITYSFCSKLRCYLEKYGRIIKSIDIKTLESLWKLDKEKNLWEQYFKSNDMQYDESIIECAKICFGPFWHEKFNKSGKKLITNKEMIKFKHECMDSKWNDLKNLLKFCDLLDKNYDVDDKKKFYVNNEYTFYKYLGIKGQNEIISRARNVFDKIEFCEIFFSNARLCNIELEKIKHILNIIENDFINDNELLRKLLFQNTDRRKSPLCQQLTFSGKKGFLLIKNFYIKHKNSWKDIQDIIVDVDVKDFIESICWIYFNEFKVFLEEVFGTDFSRIAIKIMDFVENENKLSFYSFQKQNLEDLLNLIFLNDTEKVTKLNNLICK